MTDETFPCGHPKTTGNSVWKSRGAGIDNRRRRCRECWHTANENRAVRRATENVERGFKVDAARDRASVSMDHLMRRAPKGELG